jgi:hypothetical protein
LDFIASKIRIKQGHVTGGNISDLRQSIENLDYLWSLAGLSFSTADQVEC